VKIVPYITFKGQAEEAIHLYANALDGHVSDIMRFSKEMYPDMDISMKDWVMHAELYLGEDKIYISDTFEPEKHEFSNGYTIHIDCTSKDEIADLFDAFQEFGTVTSPLEDTFWGAIYGDIRDKFGVQWSFNYQKSES
jgi:PhnB protein